MRVAPLLLSLAGCSLLSPAPQDPETIRALLELKPRIAAVYAGFKGPAVDPAGIAGVDRGLAALRDREAGKAGNEVMVGQIDRCLAMFRDHAAQRQAGTPWSAALHDNKLENMLDLVDLAVATERQKPL